MVELQRPPQLSWLEIKYRGQKISCLDWTVIQAKSDLIVEIQKPGSKFISRRGHVSHHHHALAFTAIFELPQPFLAGNLFDIAYEVVDDCFARDYFIEQSFPLTTCNDRHQLVIAFLLVKYEGISVEKLSPPLIRPEEFIGLIVSWCVSSGRQILHRIRPVPVKVDLQRTRLDTIVVGPWRGGLDDSLYEGLVDDVFSIDQSLQYLGGAPFLAHDMCGVGVVVFGEVLDVDRLELLPDLNPRVISQFRLGK